MDARHRSRRVRPLALLATTAVLAGLVSTAGPGVAQAASPWDGPWEPTVSQQQADRFVDLWADRVLDRAFMEPYLAARQVPQEIREEGYHDLDAHTRAYLTDRLFDQLARLQPDLRSQVAELGEDHARIQQQKDLLREFVFEKVWTTDVQRRFDAARPAAETQAPASARTGAPTDELLAAVADLQVVRSADLPTGELPPLQPAPAVQDQVDRLREDTPGAFLPQTTVPSSPLGLGAYQVCTASPTKAYGCTGDVPLGTPRDVDVNGDGSPDARATLTPAVNGVGSAGFRVVVQRLGAGPLPGSVTARQDVFSARKRVEVGFQSPQGLPATSTGDFLLADLAGAAAGNTHVTSTLTYSGATHPAGPAFRVADLDVTNVLSPVEGRRVEGAFSARGQTTHRWDLRMNRLPGTDEHTVDHAAGGAMDLDGQVRVFDTPTSLSRVVDATVRGLPASAQVRLTRTPTQQTTATWTASSTLPSATVTDRLLLGGGASRVTTVGATGLPRQVSVTAEALAGPKVTYTADGTLAGLAAQVQDLSGSTVTKSLATSLTALPQRFTAELLKTARGFSVAYDASAPSGTLTATGHQVSGAERVGGTATISSVPARFTLAHDGQDLAYTASSSFDLGFSAGWGDSAALAATPEPPSYSTPFVALRDGRSRSGTAMKVRGHVRGFPTAFSTRVAAPSLTLTGFRPPVGADSLTGDIELDDVRSPRVRVVARQSGIPSGVDMTVGPFTALTTSTGDREVQATYAASRPLGPLTVDVEQGSGPTADVGQVRLSGVPTAVDAKVTLRRDTSSVQVTTGQSVGRLEALYRRAGDPAWRAGLTLSEVPTQVALTFGKRTTTTGTDEATAPGLTYNANADTLDVTAFVDPALFADVSGRLSFSATNLGRTTGLSLTGTTLRVASTPRTTALAVNAYAKVRHLRRSSGCAPSCGDFLRVEYDAHGGVVPLTVENLGLRLTDVVDASLRLGVTSGIDGTYGTFGVGWDRFSAALDLGAVVRACVGFCAEVVRIELHRTVNRVLFHLGTNHEGDWGGIGSVRMCLRPHPHGASWNGLQAARSGAEGNPAAWTFIPNPDGLAPAALMEVAAAVTSPYGGGFSIKSRC